MIFKGLGLADGQEHHGGPWKIGLPQVAEIWTHLATASALVSGDH